MKSKVLLIEDDPLVAMMLEGYLDALGYEITASAASVSQSLALVASEQYDFAILDVHLANGETSEAVAMALAAAGKAFMATSGDATKMSPEYDGHPVLRKPFTIAALDQAIALLSESKGAPDLHGGACLELAENRIPISGMAGNT